MGAGVSVSGFGGGLALLIVFGYAPDYYKL